MKAAKSLIFSVFRGMRVQCSPAYLSVLHGYRVSHFQRLEKPKGGPMEIEIFLLKEVNEMGWRAPSKTSSASLINKILKFENVRPDNRKVPTCLCLRICL